MRRIALLLCLLMAMSMSVVAFAETAEEAPAEETCCCTKPEEAPAEEHCCCEKPEQTPAEPEDTAIEIHIAGQKDGSAE